MISNFKKKIYYKTLILIITLVALSFFGIKPLFCQINQTSQKLQNAQSLLNEFAQQKDYLKKLEKDCKKIEKENTYLSQILLDPQNVVNFIIALEKIADDTDNKLQIDIIPPKKDKLPNKSNIQKPIKKEEFPNIPFRLSLEGNFNSLMDFLVLLENMEYYVDTSSISIKAVKEKIKLENGKTIKKYLGNIITNIEIKVYTNQVPPKDFW